MSENEEIAYYIVNPADSPWPGRILAVIPKGGQEPEHVDGWVRHLYEGQHYDSAAAEPIRFDGCDCLKVPASAVRDG